MKQDIIKEDKYKKDGVDIAAGDVFSKYVAKLNRQTDNINPYVKIIDMSKGNFRGPRGYNFVGLPEGCVHTGGMDGIGTKVMLIDAARNYETAASNLIAMTAMDITRYGGLPLLMMNIFDVKSLGEIGSETFDACIRIMNGLHNIAMENGFVLFNGETAELGACVGTDNPFSRVAFNWGSAMIGVYHPDKMIYGETLAPGQVIIALADDFRSNGISSVRKALKLYHGEKMWNAAQDDMLACASPSVQYDRFLNNMHGWYDKNFKPRITMHLIVHLSGGAFESKLGKDMLEPLGLSAELTSLFDPPEIMQKCALWRGMEDSECYRTWNGGQGAIAVVDKKDVEKFLDSAKIWKIKAKVVGRITERKDYNVKIESRFRKKETIYYR